MEKGEKSKGIKLLTFATSIRWFGWGLGEAFIPIFMLLFSTNFFETGVLASSYYVLFFLFLPISAYLADNFKVKNMLLAAMIIYIFIGIGYFAAGITGAVVFVILSRSLNGISLSMDHVGREAYFMRHSPKGKVSQIFGRFDFITTVWWVLAVLIGLLLVEFADVKIHELLFIIAPTSLFAFLAILGLRENKKKKKVKFSISKAYLSMWKEVKSFDKNLKLIASLTFVFGFLSSIIYFFVPISAYLGGNGLVSAAVLAFIYSIPFFFSSKFGKIVDRKKGKVYTLGLILLLIITISLAFFNNYFILLIIMFLSSAVFELMSLTRRGMTAKIGKRSRLGEIDGSLNGVAALGAIVGPILFGFMIDKIGIGNSYLVIAGVTLISLIIYIGKRKVLNV